MAKGLCYIQRSLCNSPRERPEKWSAGLSNNGEVVSLICGPLCMQGTIWGQVDPLCEVVLFSEVMGSGFVLFLESTTPLADAPGV